MALLLFQQKLSLLFI